MEARPLVLVHHMNLHTLEAIAEFSWEYLLDRIYIPLADPCWVPDTDPTMLLDYVFLFFCLASS